MCPFANSFTLTNQHQTKVGLAGSCMIMVWYKLQHCRQYKYMIYTGCFIKHTIINQSKMSRDEGYVTIRTTVPKIIFQILNPWVCTKTFFILQSLKVWISIDELYLDKYWVFSKIFTIIIIVAACLDFFYES